MAEAGFPNQHTTRTTVTTNTRVETTLRFDKSYVKTIPGILKIAQLVLNIVGFISISASGLSYYSRAEYFNTVAMTGFWFTGILLAFYLFHVIEKFYKVPWLKIEMIFCAIWVILYLIASCLAVTAGFEGYSVAGVFGFIAMVTYGYDAWLKYNGVRNGELAQGERVISTQKTTVTSPTVNY